MSATPIRILMLEDSPLDAELVGARLEEIGLATRAHRVDSRESFIVALKEHAFDLILADYNVPSFDGHEALSLARSLRPDVPFIFVSGALGEERAIELLKLGATDYVLKDRLERLGPSVQRALREAREKIELRHAQDALHESERMLTTLMGNMPGMAFRCHPVAPWSFEYASPGVRDLTGHAPEDFRAGGAITWAELIHPDDLPALIAEPPITRGTQRTSRYRIRTRDGHVKWVWDRAVGIFGPDGALEFLEGFITDVTQQVEADLETQKRVDFEQQLIGIVSHDLRNPLNVVMLAASTALMHEDLDPGVARSLLKIKSASDRANRMIRDLLDFTQARLGAGIDIVRKHADLREIVGQVVDEAETTHPGRRVRIHHEGATDGDWDPDRIAQALQNLIVNALRHGLPKSDVMVRTRGTDDFVTIDVQNHGEPIPDELRARLFKPMMRGAAPDRAARSVGLGLYIVDSIVRGHGGRVTVDSSLDDGTTFRIELARWAPTRSSRMSAAREFEAKG